MSALAYYMKEIDKSAIYLLWLIVFLLIEIRNK
jgi:hypothetical protein